MNDRHFKRKIKMIASILDCLGLGLNMKQLIAVLIIIITTSNLCNAEILPHLCGNNEQVIFSCSMKSSKKILSVCSSKSLNDENSYLQYRFGKSGKVEFQFPDDRSNSIKQFKQTHYFRAKVDRRELIFQNKDVQYSVFSSFEGEESPPIKEAGVIVQKGSSERSWKTLQCASKFVDHLEKLDNVVVNDPNSDLP